MLKGAPKMATASSAKPKLVQETHIPTIVVDPTSKKRYCRGRFLGKGGFAKCYELTDMETNELFAGKIVSKTLLEKPHQKDKMAQEITIHRALKHNNIVSFHSFFEDPHNVYIILEICRRRSLMEMHKRRKAITEPETRYYLTQIVTACKYLHDNNIIHRDLKLGNLFLNDEMELKIGDFGLATKLDYAGERKKTLCGTPNYIAPEVLGKTGHSFEVDVWSLGCIMFTLLVGKPPFETDSLKDTYARIKKNDYRIPSRISSPARDLIHKMLQQDPAKRPNMLSILSNEFMVDGYMPSRLPTTCLTMAPRFDQHAELSMIAAPRRPLIEVNNQLVEMNPTSVGTNVGVSTVKREDTGENAAVGVAATEDAKDNDAVVVQGSSDFYVGELLRKLTEVATNKPPEKVGANEDEAEDPQVSPMLWVSKWVDYSDKYGLGYQLCDNSVGILFNDCTKLLLLADGDNIHYIERDGTEHYYTINLFPIDLTKKVTLLHYFRNYMNEHLLKTGASMVPRDGDELARLPYLRYWFRTRSAIVMHLTNGTMQINFFDDHTKVIVCPLMEAATYINDKREFRTYRLSGIKQYGCPRELASRLRYARTMAERIATMPATSNGNLKATSKKSTNTAAAPVTQSHN